jgi:hypothetical protein
MNKTGIILSTVVYVGASIFTLFSLSSCSASHPLVEKEIPVAATIHAGNEQAAAISSGPFVIEGNISKTVSKSRSPASVITE